MRSARLASCIMMTRRGTRAAAPVRLAAAFVLVGVGLSVVCVATGSWDGVRVGSADRAVGASDAAGSTAAQPPVSSATISGATILSVPAFTGTEWHEAVDLRTERPDLGRSGKAQDVESAETMVGAQLGYSFELFGERRPQPATRR